jgi:hypothetical protein
MPFLFPYTYHFFIFSSVLVARRRIGQNMPPYGPEAGFQLLWHGAGLRIEQVVHGTLHEQTDRFPIEALASESHAKLVR